MKNRIDQNKRERSSWIILIIIVVAGLAIPELIRSLQIWTHLENRENDNRPPQIWESIDSLYTNEKKKFEPKVKKYDNRKPKGYPRQKQKRLEKPKVFNRPLKSFDPNTAPDSLLLWILPENVANNLIKYRSSGGRFHDAEALKKIYGMEPGLYAQIVDFIDIPVNSAEEVIKAMEEKTAVKNMKSALPSTIDINSADSATWVKIRGIGPVLANRIVKFRDRLGGFHNVVQVGETYGLEPEVFTSFKDQLVLDDLPQKLEINHISSQALASHPYVNYKQANWIVKYRGQNGNYLEPDDLLKIRTLDSNFVQRISPYLSFAVGVESSDLVNLKQ